MEKINGIIISGKVYEIVETGTLLTCKECAFHKRCGEIDAPCADKFLTGNRTAIYRYSPELTELLAKPLCPEKINRPQRNSKENEIQ